MAKESRLGKIAAEFVNKNKDETVEEKQLKKKKRRQNFYISEYAFHLLRKYKNETGVPYSAAVERFILKNLDKRNE